MVLTASVVYRQVFTHHSYGYSSSVRLLADCEHLTTEEQHCANPGMNKEREEGNINEAKPGSRERRNNLEELDGGHQP